LNIESSNVIMKEKYKGADKGDGKGHKFKTVWLLYTFHNWEI